jgi:hypothetical protein
VGLKIRVVVDNESITLSKKAARVVCFRHVLAVSDFFGEINETDDLKRLFDELYGLYSTLLKK